MSRPRRQRPVRFAPHRLRNEETPRAKSRAAGTLHRGLLDAGPRQDAEFPYEPADPRRTLTTLGDLVSAACQVAGSTHGAARLLRRSSPLGRLLDRHIVIG